MEQTQSETIGEIAKAIVSVQKDMQAAPAVSENPFFKSHYADLNTCWEAVRGLLADNDLALIQTFGGTAEAPSVITTLAHGPSGEWIRGEITISPEKKTPQGVGSALTYGRRYSFAILGLTTAPDDDAEGAMDRKKKPAPKQAPKDTTKAGVDDIPLGKTTTPITEPQRKRMYAISQEHNWADTAVKSLLAKHGFDSSKDVTWEKYSTIIEELEKGMEGA